MIAFFHRLFMKIQHKLQHFALLYSLIIVEIFMLIADYSYLVVMPELAPVILIFIIIYHVWKKIKDNKKFSGFINSLIFWNYTFMWVYPFPDIETSASEKKKDTL